VLVEVWLAPTVGIKPESQQGPANCIKPIDSELFSIPKRELTIKGRDETAVTHRVIAREMLWFCGPVIRKQ
jgi:hypothetical protein